MEKLKNYSDYDALAFATDPDFQEWVLRKENDRYWQEMMGAYPEKREVMEEAVELLKSIKFKEKFPSGDLVENSLQAALETIGKKSKVFQLGRWWAAAVLVIMVGAGWYFVNTPADEKPVVATTEKVTDIEPGGNKAILTLADGRKLVLDSANNGALVNQGGVTVIKLDDGRLSYDEKAGETLEVVYNTISTPRGGQYQIVLADGSKVWLNAESSLRFPTAFVGKERRVEMTGEVYFEVAHDVAMPFLVQAGEMEVQVLGTSFNVNAYGDEGQILTTLLKGKVRMQKGDVGKIIAPGEQMKLDIESGEMKVVQGVDLDEVMAWKNGLFYFKRAGIETVMRQITRWYDIDVVFQENIPKKKFDGKIYRDVNASKVLRILEEGGIHFKIKDKKIIVTP